MQTSDLPGICLSARYTKFSTELNREGFVYQLHAWKHLMDRRTAHGNCSSTSLWKYQLKGHVFTFIFKWRYKNECLWHFALGVLESAPVKILQYILFRLKLL